MAIFEILLCPKDWKHLKKQWSIKCFHLDHQKSSKYSRNQMPILFSRKKMAASSLLVVFSASYCWSELNSKRLRLVIKVIDLKNLTCTLFSQFLFLSLMLDLCTNCWWPTWHDNSRTKAKGGCSPQSQGSTEKKTIIDDQGGMRSGWSAAGRQVQLKSKTITSPQICPLWPKSGFPLIEVKKIPCYQS